jgi:chromosome segregation ATPase
MLSQSQPLSLADLKPTSTSSQSLANGTNSTSDMNASGSQSPASDSLPVLTRLPSAVSTTSQEAAQYLQQVSAAEEKVKKLALAYRKLQQENIKVIEERSQLQSQASALTSELEQRKQEAESLKAQVDSLNVQSQHLQNQCQQQLEQLQQQQQQQQDFSWGNEDNHELAQSRDELTRTQSELETAIQSLNVTQERLKEREDQVETLRSQLLQVQQYMTEQLTQAQLERDEANFDLVQARQHIETLEQSRQLLQLQLNKTQDATGLQDVLESTQSREQELLQRLAAVESEHLKMTQALENSEAELQRTRQQASFLSETQQQVMGLEASLQLLHQQLFEKDEIVASLSTDLESTRSREQELIERLKSIDNSTQIIEFQQREQQLQQQLHRISEDLSKVCEERDGALSQVHDLQLAFVRVEAERDEEQQKLASLSEEFENLRNQGQVADPELVRTKAACDQMSAEIERLNSLLGERKCIAFFLLIYCFEKMFHEM